MKINRSFAFLFICLLPLTSWAQNWDINLLRDINIHRNKSLDPTFKTISASTVPLSFAVPAGVIAYAFIKKDEDSRKKALLITASLGSAAVLTMATKYIVNRDRPYVTYPEIENVKVENSPSFPSAHTSFSFSLATSVSLAYPKWYVVAPAYLWAGSVGYSRMHLGVHYPSDVLVGAIIGAGSTYLSYRLNEWMDVKWKTVMKPDKKTEVALLNYDDLLSNRNVALDW